MRFRGGGIRAFVLPLEAPLATAHGEIGARRGFWVGLEDDAGRWGQGEATPLPDFGTEDLTRCEQSIADGLRALLSLEAADSASPHDAIARCTDGAPCARAALECAIDDLIAQAAGVSLALLWRRRAGWAGEPIRCISVQALIGAGSPEAIVETASRATRHGYRGYKLKVAAVADAGDFDARLARDVERVDALREAIGPAPRLRLDANEGYAFDEATRALAAFEPFDIDYVEQPVAAADLEGLARLDRESPVRVAADEALLGSGLDRCLEEGAARILVVKPAAIGGFGRALALAEHARTHALRIVWSSLLDGLVSRRAALQLAAGLSPADEVHGLGTGALLSHDLGVPEIVTKGAVELAATPGLGLDASLAEADASIWQGPLERVEPRS